MGRKQKSHKRVGYSHLQLATVDGARLPSLQLASDQVGRHMPAKSSFFRQLLRDFAYGCDFFILSSNMNV